MGTQNFQKLEDAIAKGLSQNGLNPGEKVLFERVLLAVSSEKELGALKRQLWIGVGFFASSLILLLLASVFSWQAFAHSETFRYISLMFTDFKTVLDNWQDFGFTILETLPLGAMAFLLGSLIAVLGVFNFTYRQASKLRNMENFKTI